MNLESIIIRPTPVRILIKFTVLVTLFAILYSIIIFGTDYVEQARALKFFQLIELDIMAFILFTLCIIATVCVLLMQWAFETYEVRSGGIVHRKGVFFAIEVRYKLDEVETVTHKQSFLGRLFRYGTIMVIRPRLKDHFEFKNISDPARQLHLISSAIGEQRE